MDYAAYEADRKKLAARIVAVRQIIQDTTDPQERIRQTERLRILRGMYKDTLDNLERLRPPQEKHRKEQRRKISLDGFSWDFLERTKTTFADLEGTIWQAVEEGGLLGAFTGGVTAAAGGISAAIFFGYLVALIFKPRPKG